MIPDNGDKLTNPEGKKVAIFQKLQHKGYSFLAPTGAFTGGYLATGQALRQAKDVITICIEGTKHIMADKKATADRVADAKPKLTGWRKFMLDFGPLLVFFITFRLRPGEEGVFLATGTFMVAILIAAIYSKMKLGHVSTMHKFTFLVVMVMGGLTLYLQDETFVKMKLTVINGFFALALLIGMMRGQLYIKMIMELAFDLPDTAWRTLTRNYAIFFVAIALLNEFIWRTQSTEFWVNFKTFGYMGINFVFILAHMPMLMKHIPEEMLEEDKD